jgi:hypothetical protein
MKTKQLIIALTSVLLLAGLLAGCDLFKADILTTQEPEGQTEDTSDIEALIEKAQSVKKDARLELEYEKEPNKVTVSILIKNPSRKPITSVQTWLSFDPTMLKGKEIDLSNSDFELPVPYETTFDNESGLMMLGRSNPESITDESILVAGVIFAPLKVGSTVLEAYDYREDLTGHTSANAVVDEKPYNVLMRPESPLLIIEN